MITYNISPISNTDRVCFDVGMVRNNFLCSRHFSLSCSAADPETLHTVYTVCPVTENCVVTWTLARLMCEIWLLPGVCVRHFAFSSSTVWLSVVVAANVALLPRGHHLSDREYLLTDQTLIADADIVISVAGCVTIVLSLVALLYEELHYIVVSISEGVSFDVGLASDGLVQSSHRTGSSRSSKRSVVQATGDSHVARGAHIPAHHSRRSDRDDRKERK